MKQSLLVAALVIGLADVSFAQGMDIHNRFGPSGSHCQASCETQCFLYEATVTGGTSAYQIVLEVYHNGVLKSLNLETVLVPPPVYEYSCPVNMSSWGIRPGDTVTFRAKVVGLAFGKIYATDTLFADIVACEPKTY